MKKQYKVNDMPKVKINIKGNYLCIGYLFKSIEDIININEIGIVNRSTIKFWYDKCSNFSDSYFGISDITILMNGSFIAHNILFDITLPNQIVNKLNEKTI